jgi:hypothetical protein
MTEADAPIPTEARARAERIVRPMEECSKQKMPKYQMEQEE